MPTPSVQVGPPLVNFTLFAPNTADIDFTFDDLPAGEWTAEIDPRGRDPLDLDVNVADPVVTVMFPDLTELLGVDRRRLRLKLDGQVVIEGPVKLTEAGHAPATTNVNVSTVDGAAVNVAGGWTISIGAVLALLDGLVLDGGTASETGDYIFNGGSSA